jgi:hypothetical protein
MACHYNKPIALAILGGDRVIGRTLKLLLGAANYEVRLLVAPVAGNLEELLEGVQILLLAPRLHFTDREAFLDGMRSAKATAKIPILELVTGLDETQATQNYWVPWPCKMETLRKKIYEVLQKGFDEPAA